MSATGWQAAYTVRDFISGSLGKKTGITADSFKRRTGIGQIETVVGHPGEFQRLAEAAGS